MNVAPDPAQFARAVTALGDERPVVARRAIYNTQGVKIIDEGVRVDSRLYERLTRHQLSQPLAESLTTQRTVAPALLQALALELLSREPMVGALLAQPREREALLSELALLPLPPAVGFQLTVLQAVRPALWQTALRSMVVAGWLGGRLENATRHDMRMLAAGGLLYDIGLLHLDPVLQQTEVTLGPEQRRHLYAHPLVSVMLLEQHHEYPRELLHAVMEHHESRDGSGYPRGVSGAGLSRWGRVLCVTKLVASLADPAKRDGAQRLSVALRMNRHRYDAALIGEVERALPKPSFGPVEGDAGPIDGLRAVARQLSAWPAHPPADLGDERRSAVELVRSQCEQALRVLDDAGAGESALALLGAQRLDDHERAELALVAREAAWQLRVVTRQARRRIRDSEAPWPAWMQTWMADADALCEVWLGDGGADAAGDAPASRHAGVSSGASTAA